MNALMCPKQLQESLRKRLPRGWKVVVEWREEEYDDAGVIKSHWLLKTHAERFDDTRGLRCVVAQEHSVEEVTLMVGGFEGLLDDLVMRILHEWKVRG